MDKATQESIKRTVNLNKAYAAYRRWLKEKGEITLDTVSGHKLLVRDLRHLASY